MLFFYGCSIFPCGSRWVVARTTFSALSSFHSFGLKLHTIGKLLTINSSTEVLIFIPKQNFLGIPRCLPVTLLTFFP